VTARQPTASYRWRHPRRAVIGVVAPALLALLAGCASGGGAAAPTWVPQPAYTLEPNPVNPGSGPTASTSPSSPPKPGTSGAPSPSSPSAGPDPSVVATGLSAPIGITVLPDGTALVGQRTSGAIVKVQPVAGQPVTPIRTIPGLDASGDGGLLDLALSPAYDQDHLIYAYVTTPTDNRVIDFTLNGPITPVLTGIPKGATGNGGRIAFGVDGSLLIGTGNAGQPNLAQDPSSLAGKVLEVDDTGQPILAGKPVVTQGHLGLAGLCVDPLTAAAFETEPDEVNLLANGGDYGRPTASPSSVKPLAILPNSPGVAGCAVADDVLYVAGLNATALYSADIIRTATSIKLDAFTPTLTGQYGRIISVVADPDGSLWLATSNKQTTPAPAGASAADERILHIRPAGGGASTQV
jgi:glucose/arabinose dehydrogenase